MGGRGTRIDELIDTLVTAGYSPSVVRMVDEKQDYDLYDVLAELGWDMNPRTRHDRTLALLRRSKRLVVSQPCKAPELRQNSCAKPRRRCLRHEGEYTTYLMLQGHGIQRRVL